MVRYWRAVVSFALDLLNIESDGDAVVAGLAYAGLFGRALRLEEAGSLAVGRRVNEVPLDDSRILVKDGYCCMVDQAALLDAVDRSGVVREEKIRVAGKWAWVFQLVPWVELVAITGSVAGGNPGQDDDIDLLVVASKHRLWLSRLLITLLLSLLGKRRKPNDSPAHVADKLCLNMWLSGDSLVESRQDIYAANELARIVPVVNRGRAYEAYLSENQEWMGGMLPNFAVASSVKGQASRGFFVSAIVDLMDDGCRWALMKVMRRRGREVVEENVLKFHPVDHGQEILQRYEARLRELGLLGSG